MTVRTSGPDLPGLLAELATRISRLERRSALTYDGSGRAVFPSGIDTTGAGDATYQGAPDPPTGLVLTPGALFDDVFVDVEWTLAVDATFRAGHEIRVDKITDPGGPGETATVVEVITVGASVSDLRVRGLEAHTTYDVYVWARSATGVVSGTPLSGRTTTGADNTNPAQVVGLDARGAIGGIVALWDEVSDADVANGRGAYELEVDTVGTFDSPNLRSKRVGGTIATIGELVTGTTYHVRVRAIDASGNPGSWSATDTAVPVQVSTPDIAAGTVTAASAILADAAVVSAKIADLAVTDAKIASASVGKLTAGNLTVTATITTGRIAVGSGPGATGVYLDSSGLRLYNGATRTVFLDAATGNAEFTGIITATGGAITGDLTVTSRITLGNGGSIRTSSSAGHSIRIGSTTYFESGLNRIDFLDAAGSVRGYLEQNATGGNVTLASSQTNSLSAVTLLAGSAGDVIADGDRLWVQGGRLTVDKGVSIAGREIVGAHSATNLYIDDTNPQVEFHDSDLPFGTAGSRYWFHHNGGHFYLLIDRNDDGAWDSPHPMQYHGADERLIVQRALYSPTVMVDPGGKATPTLTFNNDQDTGFYSPSANILRGGVGGEWVTEWLNLSGTYYFRPQFNGSIVLGSSSNRWASVWAANGTIQTSDEITKADIAPSDLGLEFVRRVDPIRYRRKGGTRPHYGFGAGQVRDALDALGVDDFAGYIDPAHTPAPVRTDRHTDEEWETEVASWEAERTSPRGLRMDEFIAPAYQAIREVADRLEALEDEVRSLRSGR